MSDRSEEHSDDDDQSRKRPWLFGKEQQKEAPSKRQKKNDKGKGIGGFLFNPLNSLYGIIYGTDKKKKKEMPEDEDVLVDNVSPKKAQHSGPIIFLNEDRPEDVERTEAGGDDIQIERHIHRDIEVNDNSEEDEIQEVPVTVSPVRDRLQRSFEAQQEEEPEQQEEELDVVFESVVRTPNEALQAARKFETEMIYLNDNPDTPDDVSVASDIRSQDFVSPAPEDSVSRPQTPLVSLSDYSTNNVRDFWRRSTAKRPISQKRPPIRHQFKYKPTKGDAVSAIQKLQKIAAINDAKQQLSSRDRLLQGIVESGQYDVRAISAINVEAKKKKATPTPSADICARARNIMAKYQGASRSNTPSISGESSVIFEGTSQSFMRQRSPSGSSIISVSSIRSQQKVNDILSRIDSLGIKSAHRGPQRYEKAYEQSKRSEDKLREEARIREEHRIQTKGDDLENVRKTLEIQGIAVRPKIEKKKVDDFMLLPDAADRLIEKAWSGQNPVEVFVDQFDIQITRKDLATLSGLHWLNDNVINYYLQMIVDRSAKDSKYPKTYAFNTFFYTNIVTKGYASVKRWTRKIDLFSYEVILVPVHLGIHWCMAVIDMVEQKIEFYDSLYDGNTAVLPALRTYIENESQDKKKTKFDFAGWTIRQMEDIPRQKNGSDCGVFSCQFGEWASRRTTPRFTQKNMPYYRKRMVYEIVSKKLLATI